MFARTPIAALVLFAATGAVARGDELAELLRRVPAEMNTVAVINVREINKSPRAVKEKWRDNLETEYLAGAMAVPPWVPVVVIAADLHPGAVAHGTSLALIPVDNAVNSESIAKRENGIVQAMGDRSVVLSPRRGYMGVPAAGILGISGTMARQDFARWFRSAQKPERPAVSTYLQETVAAHKNAHILIVTDLQDLFDPTSARATIQQSGAVSGASEIDMLVRILSGARGLLFTAQIEQQTKATVRIEFSTPMADFVPAFKTLWPKAMEASGFEVEEFKAADVRADGKAIVMSADLSDTSLRRILSVVRAPGDAVASPEGSTAIPTPKESAVLSASLRYYRAVTAAQEDLRAQGGAKSKDYVRSAAFFDSYAAKIEKLPVANVDPVLIQYGASVAAKLRAMAGSLRGVKVQLEAYDNYKSTTWLAGRPGVIVGPFGWPRYGYGGDVALSTNVEELNKKQAELVAKLEPERARIWSVLESDRSAVRHEMLEKFKIDFDQYKK